MADPCNTRPDQQSIATAAVSQTIGGEPIAERIRSVSLRGGRSTTVRWNMVNDAGRNLDLTDTDFNVSLLVQEATAPNGCQIPPPVQFDGAVMIQASGEVAVEVDPAMLPGPGVYNAEILLTNPDADDAVVTSNLFKLILDRSLFSQLTGSGPPTLAEIRLHMADSSRFENRLLDLQRFDDAEIAAAITLAVDRWNDALPPVSPFTTLTFPFRSAWLDAIAGRLFLLEATRRRGNRLPLSAGGVQVEDQDPDGYAAIGQTLLDRFDAFCRSQKIRINLSACYGGFGSGYGQYSTY
jgi:hypothetical protein